ncbi:MAG: hypothetical protein HYY24_06530 [Verrucomicrobia bacterium]|nr:hypothetical protein [Verrucomicrobiota bacterium]
METSMQNFFAGLLRSSGQAAILIVLVLVVQRLCRHRLPPRWRHALWLLVVVRLLLPFSLESPVSIFSALGQSWTRLRTEPATPLQASDVTTAATRPAMREGLSATLPRSALPSPALPWAQAVPLFMAMWAAGAVALLIRIGLDARRMARRLRDCHLLSDPYALDLLEDCKRLMRVRRGLPVLVTAHVQGPALYGFLRPRLLLPRGLVESFSDQQLRFIFLHELAHLERHDIALNWLLTALQVAHWFNPLVWLAFHRMRADRELACDAMALACAQPHERRSYGETILKLLEGFTRPAPLPCVAGILEDRTLIAHRLAMIARFKKSSRWSVLAVALLVVLGVVGLTDAKTAARKPVLPATPANASAPREPAPPTPSLSPTERLNNLKQVAWAVLRFTEANDGQFPVELKAVQTYLPLPLSQLNLDNYRLLLSGARPQRLRHPHRVRLLLDLQKDEPDTVYPAFADGHAEATKKGAAASLLTDPPLRDEAYKPGAVGRLRTARLQVLQQLATAILQYAADNRGTLPTTLATVRSSTPALEKLDLSSYQLLLAGKTSQFAANQSRIPLLLDLQTDEPDMLYLAYLDGHAEVSKKLSQLGRPRQVASRKEPQ